MTSDLGLAAVLHAEGIEPTEIRPVTGAQRVTFHYRRTLLLADKLSSWAQGELSTPEAKVAHSRSILRALAVLKVDSLQRQGR